MKLPTFKNLLELSVICLIISPNSAWDNGELEMFDLVEEVNENFYTVMGVDQVRYQI